MEGPRSFHKDDRNRAEQIILECVRHNTADIVQMGQSEIDRLKKKFFIDAADIAPRVFLRITDNWVELTVPVILNAVRNLPAFGSQCRRHDFVELAKKGVLSEWFGKKD